MDLGSTARPRLFFPVTAGSCHIKVYVHLDNDDGNQAIRDEYSLNNKEDEEKTVECPFCNEQNRKGHGECRNCGRPLVLKRRPYSN